MHRIMTLWCSSLGEVRALVQMMPEWRNPEATQVSPVETPASVNLKTSFAFFSHDGDSSSTAGIPDSGE